MSRFGRFADRSLYRKYPVKAGLRVSPWVAFLIAFSSKPIGRAHRLCSPEWADLPVNHCNDGLLAEHYLIQATNDLRRQK